MTCCGQEINLNSNAITFLRNLATRLPQIDEILDSWIEYKWPYYYENNIIMFHAPVGNQFILSDKHKVKIFMSGYCVSGDAGVKYVSDVIKNKNKFTSPKDASNNSFNTRAMINGITKIVEDLSIDKLLKISSNEIFTASKNKNSPILFTQALCPIVNGKEWSATKVRKSLEQSEEMRKFASFSLQTWLSYIQNFCDNDTKLILFGKTKDINCDGSFARRNIKKNGGELIKLLMCSYIENGVVKITNKDQDSNSLYDKILNDFSNNVFVVPHPAYYDVWSKVYLKDAMFKGVL